MPWAPSRAGCRPPDEQPGAGDSSGGGPRAAQVGKCMESTCPYTEPTDLLPDTPELPDGVDAPAIRVDFMLGHTMAFLRNGVPAMDEALGSELRRHAASRVRIRANELAATKFPVSHAPAR